MYVLTLLIIVVLRLNPIDTCQRFSIHIDENRREPNKTFIRSPIFALIIETIRNSTFYNPNSNNASLHIAPVDTIDRDRRSKNGHFLFFIEQRFRFFDEWTDPNKTHLIINHYTGTWPRYDRRLDFRLPIRSIVASPSFTSSTYSPSSHVSFPLFHSDYPRHFPQSFYRRTRSIFLSFKGKSYGDVEHHRTFFRHLHNDRDILIEFTDDENEKNSSRFDYFDLISSSEFCLVPSGRRLGSYRFLESLQFGCIPVITTENDESIVLPFNELINWSNFVIIYSNSSLSLLPHFLRKISSAERERMRQNCFSIWKKNFSSIVRIVSTLLDIVSRRFCSLSTSSNRSTFFVR